MEVADDPELARTARGEGAHTRDGGFGTSVLVYPARRADGRYMMEMWEVPELNPAIPHKYHELAAAFFRLKRRRFAARLVSRVYCQHTGSA